MMQLQHTHLPFQQEPGKVFVAINSCRVINFHSRELPAHTVWEQKPAQVTSLLPEEGKESGEALPAPPSSTVPIPVGNANI